MGILEPWDFGTMEILKSGALGKYDFGPMKLLKNITLGFNAMGPWGFKIWAHGQN
jgi:hypothetical protein